MKVLKSGINFERAAEINPKLGDEFLIKQSIATGWAMHSVVKRVLKKQIELEVVNVIPTEESNRFGIKNGLKDRNTNFFSDWALTKKANIGKRRKFFKDNCIEVGSSNSWNPSILAKLIK